MWCKSSQCWKQAAQLVNVLYSLKQSHSVCAIWFAEFLSGIKHLVTLHVAQISKHIVLFYKNSLHHGQGKQHSNKTDHWLSSQSWLHFWYLLISLTKLQLSPNLVVMLFMNSAVSDPLLTSRLPVPLLHLLFPLNSITVTLYYSLPCPPFHNIWALIIVRRIRDKINRTAVHSSHYTTP